MILNVRDKDGNFVSIPAIKGEAGKSAYEQAKDGGYTGTLEEFIALLNGLTNSEDAAHYSDFNNPHKVTAHQIGALAKAYEVSYALDVEIQRGGNAVYIHNYCEDSLNTPYKEGKTNCTHGMVITNAYNANYGTQMCIPSGESAIYTRTLNGQGITNWVKTAYNNSLSGVAIGVNAYSDNGGAIGEKSRTQSGGSIGYDADSLGGGAVGYCADTESGGAVGESTLSTSGGAVGYCASTADGGAIGAYAEATSGFAGGYNAKALVDAIQLGEGENENERTLQVYDYQLMDANGLIPSERLPFASGSYKGTNVCGTKNPNTLTFDFVPKFVIVSQRGERNATGGGCFIWINSGSTLNFINNGSNYWVHPTLTDKTLSWYCSESASYQLNSSSYTYDYFAWG